MSRMYLQVEAPKYEHMLPATCSVIADAPASAILWEAYIDHRTSQPVYLCSMSDGNMHMLPEDKIVTNSVVHVQINKAVE